MKYIFVYWLSGLLITAFSIIAANQISDKQQGLSYTWTEYIISINAKETFSHLTTALTTINYHKILNYNIDTVTKKCGFGKQRGERHLVVTHVFWTLARCILLSLPSG